LRKNVYDSVASRWQELGLTGEPPAVRAFEQDDRVLYHEVGGFEPGAQPGEEKENGGRGNIPNLPGAQGGGNGDTGGAISM
jgi:hypothetical protein